MLLDVARRATRIRCIARNPVVVCRSPAERGRRGRLLVHNHEKNEARAAGQPRAPLITGVNPTRATTYGHCTFERVARQEVQRVRCSIDHSFAVAGS